MKEQFVTYEIALKLKELGFNEKCFSKWEKDIGRELFHLYPILASFGLNSPYDKESNGYDQKQVNEGGYVFTGYKNSVLDHGLNVIAAPLWQQAIDFFRDKYNIHFEFKVGVKPIGNNIYKGECFKIFGDMKRSIQLTEFYPTFYEAREQAILKAIELCKKL